MVLLFDQSTGEFKSGYSYHKGKQDGFWHPATKQWYRYPDAGWRLTRLGQPPNERFKPDPFDFSFVFEHDLDRVFARVSEAAQLMQDFHGSSVNIVWSPRDKGYYSAQRKAAVSTQPGSPEKQYEEEIARCRQQVISGVLSTPEAWQNCLDMAEIRYRQRKQQSP
jgi:hypothetical protein